MIEEDFNFQMWLTDDMDLVIVREGVYLVRWYDYHIMEEKFFFDFTELVIWLSEYEN